MTKVSVNYAQALMELKVPAKAVEETERILKEVPALQEILDSPLVTREKKERIIDRIFPEAVRSFLKVACLHGRSGQLEDMIQSYRELAGQRDGVLKAELLYVTLPSEETVKQMKTFLRNKYHRETVVLDLKRDASLLGGFLLRTGDYEYDYSLKGRYRRLSQTLTRR